MVENFVNCVKTKTFSHIIKINFVLFLLVKQMLALKQSFQIITIVLDNKIVLGNKFVLGNKLVLGKKMVQIKRIVQINRTN